MNSRKHFLSAVSTKPKISVPFFPLKGLPVLYLFPAHISLSNGMFWTTESPPASMLKGFCRSIWRSSSEAKGRKKWMNFHIIEDKRSSGQRNSCQPGWKQFYFARIHFWNRLEVVMVVVSLPLFRVVIVRGRLFLTSSLMLDFSLGCYVHFCELENQRFIVLI